MSGNIFLCRVGEIPDGESRGFDPDGVERDTLFIVRQGAKLYGWRDQCPHEGETPLPWQRHRYLNAMRTRIVCFAHGAQFNIATGECILGPCRGSFLSPVHLFISDVGEVWLRSINSSGLEETGSIPIECHSKIGHEHAR